MWYVSFMKVSANKYCPGTSLSQIINDFFLCHFETKSDFFPCLIANFSTKKKI